MYFWQQAAEFKKAAQVVNEYARALPAYYCMLNCAKALLECRGMKYSPYHGLSGGNASRSYLANEWVQLRDAGILVSLIEALTGGKPAPETFNLKELLRYLAFIHRAYCLTYASIPEIFIPVTHPKFVIGDRNRQVLLTFEVSSSGYADKSSFKRIPEAFEVEYIRMSGAQSRPCLFSKESIVWKSGKTKLKSNIRNLYKFHYRVRGLWDLIVADCPLWYLRKSGFTPPWPEPAIMYAVMHRLSEIARYSPKRLINFSGTRYYWLIQEFLNGALDQFIDRIASEITGQEFYRPGRRA